MPIHDWTRVESGTFHDFHRGWTIEIRSALNAGLLPDGYYAMVYPRDLDYEVSHSDDEAYALMANRIGVRHQRGGGMVAVIDILSPGLKLIDYLRHDFIVETIDFLQRGVHHILVDLFPPTPHDPDGIHQAIWDELFGEPFDARPEGKPLTAAAYDSGNGLTAYVEPLSVGDLLPEMPLFLEPGYYVPMPLEATYRASWNVLPGVIRELVETRA